MKDLVKKTCMLLWLIFLAASCVSASPKYVFLFIGDGMGPAQVRCAEIYAASADGKNEGGDLLYMTRMETRGFVNTHSLDSFITDSAAAGTALASGRKTASGVVSMDPSGAHEYRSLASCARENGMKVGIVSSVSLDHATPACFYAHEPDRGDYYDIGLQLTESGFDYFGGGGLKGNKDKYRKGRADLMEAAVKKGFTLAEGRDAFESLRPGAGRVMTFDAHLDGNAALHYEIDRKKGDISLAEFTQKGIELLDNDENGFFMMVEGGKIDWACHANDAAGAILEVIAFDRAVGEAVRFMEEHPDDTLIVVTADHECGGMSVGYAETGYDTYYSDIYGRKGSYQSFYALFSTMKEKKYDFDRVMRESAGYFGLLLCTDREKESLKKKAEGGDRDAEKRLRKTISGHEAELLRKAYARSIEGGGAGHDYVMYGGYDPFTMAITRIADNKAGIAWTTYSHTGVPVPVFASGAGAAVFSTCHDNTEIPARMMEFMNAAR